MRRLSLIALLTASLAAPALAQTAEYTSDYKACRETVADAEKRVGFCTSALKRAPGESGVKGKDIAMALLFRAEAYLTQKKFIEAIKDADDAGKSSQYDPQVENMRCWTRAVANRELDVAKAACDEAIRLNKDDPGPHDSRGLVGLRQKKWQQAYDGYREAAPFLNMPGSRYGLGLAALALGKTKDGERWIKEALERDPKSGDELKGFGFTPEAMKKIGAKAKPN